MWTLLLLTATVWSFALAARAFRSQQKMVLWPGCEGRAVWNLHKKHVRSLQFVVKTRGCCCNLSVGVVLNVWFTMNRICRKNNTTYMWCEQAIVEYVNSIVAYCHSVKLCTLATQAFQSQQPTVITHCFLCDNPLKKSWDPVCCYTMFVEKVMYSTFSCLYLFCIAGVLFSCHFKAGGPLYPFSYNTAKYWSHQQNSHFASRRK